MAEITQADMLTAAELLALRDALMNEPLVSALQKVFHFDGKMHSESMENEALAAEPNVNRIIQSAARSRSSRELLMTLKTRMGTLTPKQRQ